eukprot:TRINITY_DN262_c0_g1_i1.p1 TRINITY_DN262_c0_g1~~TRINITY_DN262_c0_g1_i1.p1  ORF type:complete len:297 (+),score=153.84 TRINITY_DN262_c0_g1_i1:49-939(+)
MMMRAAMVLLCSVAVQARLPTVVGHGMGDSCFNSGMKKITELVGTTTSSYSVCVPTGDNREKDTSNGFFMNMDKNVDVFAEKIRADPNLAGGFNAVGFSQGNSLIRGYIHKYNNPPVSTFLSVHGTVMGVSGFPQCNPSHGVFSPLCLVVDEILGDAAYTKAVQDDLFQAGYFRDPKRVNGTEYKKNSQIAQWNNEGENFNQTYKDNFISVKRFAMIKAEKDSMVYPREGEWWGEFQPHSFKTILSMNETEMYQKDLFGLKTVDEAGKILFNSTTGNHLEFTDEQLTWWVENYFVE